MNYVISYWVPPETSDTRKDALKAYFDLQCFSKKRFGAKQTIVTNLDYPGAIPFVEPRGFRREYGLFAMYFGLGQLIDEGLEFPIAVHDHDMFVRDGLTENDDAIQCVLKFDEHTFGEQLIVFPEISRPLLMDYIKLLRTFDFPTDRRMKSSAVIRHEQMFSSEMTLAALRPQPFAGMPVTANIRYRDTVSFDIQGHHSLDAAYCECNPIPNNTQAVHGHINKGPATDLLLEWLMEAPSI